MLKYICLFVIVYTNIFSAVFGPTQYSTGNTSVHKVINARPRANGPKYVWREYGENVNQKLEGDGVIPGWVQFNSIASQLSYSAELYSEIEGIGYRFENLTASSTSGVPIIKETTDTFYLIGADNVDLNETNVVVTPKASVYLEIPSYISDGMLNVSCRILKYSVGSLEGNSFTANVSRSFSFELITYLNIKVGKINFGKVMFTKNAPDERKESIVEVFGGANKSVEIETEAKTELVRVGGRESLPIYLGLKKGDEKVKVTNIVLDSTGKGQILLEALLRPSLYPDVPEGKYVGVANLQVKYN